MTIESALLFLLAIVVLFAVGWIAHYFISSFFPAPIQTPALLVVGVILLIILILAALRFFPIALK